MGNTHTPRVGITGTQTLEGSGITNAISYAPKGCFEVAVLFSLALKVVLVCSGCYNRMSDTWRPAEETYICHSPGGWEF